MRFCVGTPNWTKNKRCVFSRTNTARKTHKVQGKHCFYIQYRYYYQKKNFFLKYDEVPILACRFGDEELLFYTLFNNTAILYNYACNAFDRTTINAAAANDLQTIILFEQNTKKKKTILLQTSRQRRNWTRGGGGRSKSGKNIFSNR